MSDNSQHLPPGDRNSHFPNGHHPQKTAIPQPLHNNHSMDIPAEGSEEVSVLLHRLQGIPPDSTERIDVIRSILPHVSMVEDKEAQDVIDALDSALDSAKLDPDLFRKCLRALRKICGITGMFPLSHMLTEGLAKKGNVPAASGGFADVWDGTYHGNHVAIKALRVYRNDDQDALRKMFCKEVVVWKRLTHPNILPLVGVSTTLFIFCMVSPWMKNGNVMEFVGKNPNANRVQLLMGVGKGLEFLHSLGIVHGDLKGANILIDDSGEACLADFGLTSIITNLNSLNVSTLVSRPSGTVRWMAPETLDPEMFDIPALPTRGFSTASDVYAFAMVIIEIFTGNLPFQEFRNDPSVIVKVMQGERPKKPEPEQAPGLSDQLWELSQMCWQQERSERPAIASVLGRLEAILYTNSQPPPDVVHRTSLDRTCIRDSNSSVAVPSQPIEETGTAATSRGNALKKPLSRDPIIAQVEQNSGPEVGKTRIRFTQWPRKFLRSIFSCM